MNRLIAFTRRTIGKLSMCLLAVGMTFSAWGLCGEFVPWNTWTDPATGRSWSYDIVNAGVHIGGCTPEPTGALGIPASIEGLPVTSISDNAFEYCTGLTSVTIPNSVSYIGDSAFDGCSALTRVTLPSSAENIGYYAFSGCSRLTSVIIPENVTRIGGWAFNGCINLKSVKIPDRVSFIEECAFEDCNDQLYDTTTIPGVTLVDGWAIDCDESLAGRLDLRNARGIGCGAFSNCSRLTSVTMPNGMTEIGPGTFYNCSGLVSVTIPDGITSIELSAFSNCSGLTRVNIPSSVTYIGFDAFSGCSSLTSVTIPNSVTDITSGAFSGCSSLTSVTIPNSVTQIGGRTFEGCIGLTSVTIGNGVTSIGENAFEGCSDMLYDKTTIPGVTLVDGWVVDRDDSLSGRLNLKNVRGIADGVLSHCGGLTGITLPSSMTNIGQFMFESCTGLTSVTIPNNVTRIREYAFSGCSSLTSVTIPDSVIEIGIDAFEGCSDLLYDKTTISGVTLVGGWAVDSDRSLSGKLNLKGIRGVADFAFDGCIGLMSVTMNNGVKTIGDYAFSGCTGLTSVTIPDSVMGVGEYAFEDCNDLLYDRTTNPGVRLVDGWVVDSDGSLSGKLNLKGVRGIADCALEDCIGLTSVTMNSGVKTIGACAFEYCTGLVSVTIPGGVTSIGAYAFEDCIGLTSVTIPDSVTSIGQEAFYYCERLVKARVPMALKKMIEDRNVFSGCSKNLVIEYLGASAADPVQSSYCHVSVGVADDCEGMGTVSGAKIVKENANVTISAKANKGNAFAGWYDDYGDLVSLSASYAFKATGDVMYTARFVAAREDWLWVYGDDQKFDVGELLQGEGNLSEYFAVDSGSAPTIKVSGLPSGLKYDAKTQTISGRPAKRGIYYVTCSAQNGNGYKMSCAVVWNVGYVSNGDYDNIGIGYVLEELEYLQVGVPVYICASVKSVSGLPSGLKFNASVPTRLCGEDVSCDGGNIVGTPTKAGVFKLTFTDHYGAKAVKTVIVSDGESGYLEVVGDRWRGNASGSGVYAAGATVKLSAKPASGYYFAGWYEDPDYEYPFSRLSDWRKSGASFVFDSGMIGASLYARYVSKYDDYIFIDGFDSWNVNDEYSYDYYVSSETLPTETVKGLPAGIKWDKEGRYFYVDDRTKLKPGTSIATITAKNLSGHTDTKTVRIVVPNLESWVFDGLDYSDDAYNFTAGVCLSCCEFSGFDFQNGYKVTASGMPPGIKLNIGYNWITFAGTPVKAGTYTVTLTAKRGNYTEKATFTINVHPLPDFAVGTFNGVLRDEYDKIVGTFTFTAAANGKQSVKVTTAEGTISLSAPEWNCRHCDEDGNILGLTALLAKRTQNEEIMFDLDCFDSSWNFVHHYSMGSFRYVKGEDVYFHADITDVQRSPFSKPLGEGSYEAAYIAEGLSREYGTKKMAVLWDYDLNAYRLECADCVYVDDAEGLVTLKATRNGTVAISGKLFGANFTASAPLLFDTECVNFEDTWGYGEFGTWKYGEHCYVVFAPVLRIRECVSNLCGFWDMSSGSSFSPRNSLIPIYWFP